MEDSELLKPKDGPLSPTPNEAYLYSVDKKQCSGIYANSTMTGLLCATGPSRDICEVSLQPVIEVAAGMDQECTSRWCIFFGGYTKSPSYPQHDQFLHLPVSTFKLPHETSSTEAELVAIHEALKLVSARPPGSWTVLTDSKLALEALSSPRSQVVTDVRSLILVVHNLLVTSGHSVWFQWVPSHIGLPGNTRADTAAKRAHGAAECNTVIPLSPSVCRIHIRRRLSFVTHPFMENTVAVNTFLHRIDPKMAFSVSLRLSRKEESALHRLRLNVARTPSFLFKTKQRPSSACPSCSTDADTHHLLMTCPRYAAPRTALTRRLSAVGHRDLSLATLLGPVGQKQWAVTKALICFLGDTGLLDCL
ncbi:uncharacterized protein LOC135370505 [Ornithodoros turicata]|uniref:uncharacterized protein LOC135370505 n=1 Tax=Ornithodoros turicata TaxID=34597 RepID=UPI003139A9A2